MFAGRCVFLYLKHSIRLIYICPIFIVLIILCVEFISNELIVIIVLILISFYPHNRPWRLKICDVLRIQHCLGNWFTDGPEVSITHRPYCTFQTDFYFVFWYLLLLNAE
jgi:hypothetical protein